MVQILLGTTVGTQMVCGRPSWVLLITTLFRSGVEMNTKMEWSVHTKLIQITLVGPVNHMNAKMIF